MQALFFSEQAECIFNHKEVNIRLRQIDPNFCIDFFQDLIFASKMKIQNWESPFYAKSGVGALLQITLSGLLSERTAEFQSEWRTIHTKGGGTYIVSPEQKYAIFVTRGTSNVGMEYAKPTNKCLKGPVLEDAINGTLKDLQEYTQIWIVFFHYEKDIFTMELSHATNFGYNRITALKERIVFPTIDFNPVSDDTILRNEQDNTKTEEITIKRKRKAA